MARSRRTSADPASADQATRHADESRREEAGNPAADLNYNQARAALDLILNQLQASDLDIESMVGLYQRGQAYANRCEEILEQVEQDVQLWDSSDGAESQPRRWDPTAPATP
jgi:exodeoxyribonuclease VII small subunit